MTDPIIPDRIADDLLAGSADPAEIAAELRGVAGLTAAAHQAPTEGELAGMTSAVAAFQAVVTAPASAAGAATTRSVSHMISTRLPKRAAIISAVTVVLAGTAAAAAAGAVPSFGSPSIGEDPVVTTIEGETTSTATTDPNSTTTDSSTTSTTEDPTTTEASETTEPGTTGTSVALYPGRDYGLCTAWTHGAPKKITNPAFSYLVDQAVADAAAPEAPADEAATRAAVDEYCDKVIADKKGTDDGDDATDDTEATDDETTETATSVDHTAPSHPSGNGKGNGQGKGHGKP